MSSKLKTFLEDLALYPDRAERIEALIAISDGFANPSQEELPRTPATRVPGCESEVYITSEPFSQGKKFKFAVDNPQGISAMAMAQILDENLSGEPIDEVRHAPEDLAFQVFGNELSMGKSLGLTGMLRMVKLEAERP
jgi:cysteine desulfuration protein SufE